MVSTTLRPLYPGKETRYPFIGGWVGLGAGLDGSKKSHLTGVRSPDRPAFSELPYGLRYSGRLYWKSKLINESLY